MRESLIPRLQAVPQIPYSSDVYTYTMFASQLEPYEFTGWIDESMSWKETCYIGDWSPLGKFRVTGPDALAFFSSIAGNDFTSFAIGQAKHLVLSNSTGKIVGDGILMRLAEEDFLFTSGPGVSWAEFMFSRGTWRASAANHAADGFIFQIQGPTALLVMEKVTGENLRDIGFMRFREARIADAAFNVLRQGMAGEVGFELHGHTRDALDVYSAILEAGKEFGVRRLGGRTKMVNHVEACFPTPGVDYIPAVFGPEAADFREFLGPRAASLRRFKRKDGSLDGGDVRDLYRTAIELGWGKTIKFNHDFVGRGPLEAESRDPRRSIVTLVWNSDDVIEAYARFFRKGELVPYMEMPRELLGAIVPDKVTYGGRIRGISTSRCYSVYFREMISLCTLDVELCKPGTQVTVIWGTPGHAQMEIRATVAKAPYKQDNRRADLSSPTIPGSTRPAKAGGAPTPT